jgi:hypothetical protein
MASLPSIITELWVLYCPVRLGSEKSSPVTGWSFDGSLILHRQILREAMPLPRPNPWLEYGTMVFDHSQYRLRSGTNSIWRTDRPWQRRLGQRFWLASLMRGSGCAPNHIFESLKIHTDTTQHQDSRPPQWCVYALSANVSARAEFDDPHRQGALVDGPRRRPSKICRRSVPL